MAPSFPHKNHIRFRSLSISKQALLKSLTFAFCACRFVGHSSLEGEEEDEEDEDGVVAEPTRLKRERHTRAQKKHTTCRLEMALCPRIFINSQRR